MPYTNPDIGTNAGKWAAARARTPAAPTAPSKDLCGEGKALVIDKDGTVSCIERFVDAAAKSAAKDNTGSPGGGMSLDKKEAARRVNDFSTRVWGDGR